MANVFAYQRLKAMSKEALCKQKCGNSSSSQFPRRLQAGRAACLLRPGQARAPDASTNLVQLCFPVKGTGPAHAPLRSPISLTDQCLRETRGAEQRGTCFHLQPSFIISAQEPASARSASWSQGLWASLSLSHTRTHTRAHEGDLHHNYILQKMIQPVSAFS